MMLLRSVVPEKADLSALEYITGGTILNDKGNGYSSLPAFRRMRIALHPAERSNIRVELWLPDEWNGRYAATGNGGIGGSLVYDMIAKMMRDGCACANTDIGTSAGLTSGFENDEVKADYGYRATHLMAVRLGYGLIMNSPFIDGNKRIGTHAMLLTIKRNGIQLSDTQEELAEIILNIASRQKDYGSLLAWVIHHKKSEQARSSSAPKPRIQKRPFRAFFVMFNSVRQIPLQATDCRRPER